MDHALRTRNRGRLATAAGLTGAAVLCAHAPAQAAPAVDVSYAAASASLTVSSQPDDTGEWTLIAFDGETDIGVAAAGTYPAGGRVELTCGEDGDWLMTAQGAVVTVTGFTLLNTDYDLVEIVLDDSRCVVTPEPTSPEPTSPEPTSPEPTSPEPTSPEPTSPEPTSPEPTSPEPTSPEPTTPEPTTPAPTSAAPTTSVPTPSTDATPSVSASADAAGTSALAETGASALPLGAAGAAVALGSLLVWRRRRQLDQDRAVR